MKRFSQSALAAAVIAALSMFTVMSGADAQQQDQKELQPVTVTGTSACAACDGDIEGHDILLYTGGEQGQKSGVRVVVSGSGPDYKKAHEVRRDSKQMTALLQGPLQAKTDKNGNPYLQAKAAQIKIQGS